MSEEDQGKEGESKPRRKMSWLDWVLLLLAAAIMVWLVEYSMNVIMSH